MVNKDRIYENIFATIASRVSPTTEEAINEKAFAESIRKKLQKAFGKKAQLFFVGSTARDTGIRGDKDIDIFAAFPKAKSKEEIVKTTIAIVKRTLKTKWEMHYAEHPYLQGHIEGFKIEVVPCFKIKVNEGIISAVDRTPLHALYLQKHLTQKQKRDVRVLKALLKAHNIYGAELEIEGFSGLVCEYLILNYRSLLGLLKAATQWKPPIVLDIEDYYDEEYDYLIQRFKTPLIIIDFIDKNRNAAAAISGKSFEKLIAISKAFVANPSEKWFEKQKVVFNEKKLIQKLSPSNFILLKMAKPENLVSDILIPQLRKSGNSIAKQLELRDFEILESYAFVDEKSAYLAFELASLILPNAKKIIGPPLSMPDHVENFRKSHKGAKLETEKGRAVLVIKRKHSESAQVISEIRRKPQNYGVASHFAEPFAHHSYFQKDTLLKEIRKNRYLQEKFAEILFSKSL